MNDPVHPPTFERPFPALTPAQRYHFDVFGYTIIENTLSKPEVESLKNALYELKDELLSLEDPSERGPRVRGSYAPRHQPHHTVMTNLVEAKPEITAYTTHPWLVAMSEEIMGNEARLVEINAQINSRDPGADMSKPPRFGFHRGTDIPYRCHEQGGLFHCSFVKTLTNLTDLGPDDGGTVVVAGSHKVNVPESQLVEAAYEDRSLIHQVIAPAGSTLLFAETLIHATGQLRSDKERVILIAGYGSTMFPYWDNGSLSEEFQERIPAQLRTLFKGKVHWTRNPVYRSLDEPRDERTFGLGQWDDRAPRDSASAKDPS